MKQYEYLKSWDYQNSVTTFTSLLKTILSLFGPKNTAEVFLIGKNFMLLTQK